MQKMNAKNTLCKSIKESLRTHNFIFKEATEISYLDSSCIANFTKNKSSD